MVSRHSIYVVRGRTAFACVIVLALAAGACATGPASNVDDEVDVRRATLDCASAIDVVQVVPDGFAVIDEVAALPIGAIHGLGRSGPDEGGLGEMRFAKMALLVGSNTEFSIEVSDESSTNALIAWSSATSTLPVSSLAAGPCLDRGTDDWLVFAGGVWVLEPACVSLQFATSQGTTEVRLQVGAECR